MKTNKEKLVIMSVCGKIHHPTLRGSGHYVGYDGYGRINVGTGGITYNYTIGDVCMGICGDHVEPGVSLKNSDNSENAALNTFACIGNVAKVMSGDAKGKLGFVTGTHGGVDHTMIYFDSETLEQLCIDDKIQIKAWGQGLKADEFPEVRFMNLDPSLLDNINIIEDHHTLTIPVACIVPAHIMGSGLGSSTVMSGDYDIMTQDKEENQKYGIDKLRFGDLVAVLDHNNHNGPHYQKGAVSVGVVVHSDSYTSGHGPGLTIIMSGTQEQLKLQRDDHANIASYLLK